MKRVSERAMPQTDTPAPEDSRNQAPLPGGKPESSAQLVAAGPTDPIPTASPALQEALAPAPSDPSDLPALTDAKTGTDEEPVRADGSVEDRKNKLATAVSGVSKKSAEDALAAIRRKREEQAKEGRVKETKAKNLQGTVFPLSQKRLMDQLESLWREKMHALVGAVVGAWGPRERKMVSDLLDRYGTDGQVIRSALLYVLEEWEPIKTRFRVGAIPSLGFLYRFHEVLCIEAQRWVSIQPTLREWDDWWKANPGATLPPTDLRERHDKAKAEFDAMRGSNVRGSVAR